MRVIHLIADLAYYDYTGNTNIRQTIKMVKENPLNPNRFFYTERTERTERSGGSEATNLQELVDAYNFQDNSFNSKNIILVPDDILANIANFGGVSKMFQG
jgi:hypothetical protein